MLQQRAAAFSTSGEPIWALAERLNTVMNEWGEVFAQGGALLDELARLAPVADST